MAKIKCPKCEHEFELSQDSYNDLLNEIASEEVAKRVSEQTKALEATFNAKLALEQEKAKAAQDKEVADLKAKLTALEQDYNAKLNIEKANSKAQIEKELAELKQQNATLTEQLKNSNSQIELEVEKANSKASGEITELKAKLAALEQEYKSKLEVEKANSKAELEKQLADLKQQNSTLVEKLNNSESLTQLEVNKANAKANEELAKKDNEIVRLQGELKLKENETDLSTQKLKEQYDFQLKAKDEEIKHWKEFRVGDSTKDIGESLEQYCHDKFDEIRAIAYPNAYFEKDNEVVGGTKGDFIFKDYTDEDSEHEIVSIMFEMKNQKEDGDTKNESHLKKLDSDRQKKKCEYAVLVSTLEPDSNLYNAGIVDVSHKYPKMFVVRPQFFLTIIGLIKNMAKTRFEYKMQVIEYQRENADITNFENAVRAVAQRISEDYENAGKQYDKVEKMCDDMIKKLTDLKEVFRLGKKWIGAAQNQLPELEIRKLTKNNPTMKEKFDQLKKDENE